ncbi:hypothetical protein PBRA_004829 [Plasmodiophora brassicae]|nr:hypothetical protein PBRA_004829 [Plasmodiophora brassicae]
MAQTTRVTSRKTASVPKGEMCGVQSRRAATVTVDKMATVALRLCACGSGLSLMPVVMRFHRRVADLGAAVDRAAFAVSFFPLRTMHDAACMLAALMAQTVDGVVDVEVGQMAARSQNTFVKEIKPWGDVQIIHETAAAGIYSLNIEPGQSIPMHVHERLDEVEMASSPNLQCQGQPFPFGAIRRWPCQEPHCHVNTDQSRRGHILCIDRPSFIAGDEIPVTVDQGRELHNHNLGICHSPWTEQPVFTFDGGYNGQTVRFVVDNAVNQRADAVLVAVLSADHARIVICRHHSRGWELPGGKVEPDEAIEAAARREVEEETGYILRDPVFPVGYYEIREECSADVHTKQVFLAYSKTRKANWNRDEMPQVKPVRVSDLVDIVDQGGEQISPLMKDNVIRVLVSLIRGQPRLQER